LSSFFSFHQKKCPRNHQTLSEIHGESSRKGAESAKKNFFIKNKSAFLCGLCAFARNLLSQIATPVFPYPEVEKENFKKNLSPIS